MNWAEAIAAALAITKDLGPVGLVIFFGWLNMRWVDKKLADEKAARELERKEAAERFVGLVEQSKRHMMEQRKMYEDNVVLVKGYEGLAHDLSGIITLTTQTMTELVQMIRNNLYCPIVRERGPHP